MSQETQKVLSNFISDFLFLNDNKYIVMELKIVKAEKRFSDERKDKNCLICDQPS